jgi:hypothetical protein
VSLFVSKVDGFAKRHQTVSLAHPSPTPILAATQTTTECIQEEKRRIFLEKFAEGDR